MKIFYKKKTVLTILRFSTCISIECEVSHLCFIDCCSVFAFCIYLAKGQFADCTDYNQLALVNLLCVCVCVPVTVSGSSG